MRRIDPSHFRVSLRHAVARVVLRMVLFIGAVVGDSADNFFGVVNPRQGTLCVGPIVLGLAQGVGLGQWFADYFFVLMPRGVLRVELPLEIAEVVSLRCFGASLHIKVWVLLVGKSGKTQYACRIRCCRVTVEFSDHRLILFPLGQALP